MENELPEENSRSDVDYIPDIVTCSQKTLIFGIYTKLNEFERHFEIVSTKYKYVALTWLLASFAGIGFLLSTESTELPFPHMIAVAIVSFIGLIGVSLIGNFDVNVYHRFWAALFVEEVVMEERYKFLLQSRKITLLIDESRERVFSQGLLYQVANSILIITMGVCLVYELSYLPAIFVFLIVLFFLALMLLSWVVMLNTSRRIQRGLHDLIKVRLKEERRAR